LVHRGGNVKGPVRAALHFLVRPTVDIGRLGIDDGYRLIAEGTVPAGIAGSPGPGHTENPRAARTSRIRHRGHHVDHHTLQIALVHRGGNVKGPIRAALHFLVRSAVDIGRLGIDDGYRLVAEVRGAAGVRSLPGPSDTENLRAARTSRVGHGV